MSRLTVRQDPTAGGWEVWIGLDCEEDPIEGVGFIVGTGETPAAALLAAQRDLLLAANVANRKYITAKLHEA